MAQCEHACCQHHSSSSVNQTMDEMEFERGIWSAALNGESERIHSLLASGKDVCQVDSSGYTALLYAARSGHKDICQQLLDHGACVNAQTRSGKVTALHRAAYCGHDKVVELLLRRGADVIMVDSDGMTALHKACERNHFDIAKILVSKAPSMKDIKDNRGKSAIQYVKERTEKWTELLPG